MDTVESVYTSIAWATLLGILVWPRHLVLVNGVMNGFNYACNYVITKLGKGSKIKKKVF